MQKKKNILIHSNYKPDNHGGIEVVVSQLIELLSSLGYTVKCFCGDMESSGSTVYKETFVVFRRVIKKIAGAPIISFGNTAFLINAKKTDLIIFQEPFPFLWPAIMIERWLYRTPIIVLVHANPVATKIIKKLYGLIRSIVFKGAVCVATSPNLLNKVDSSLFIKRYVVPLGIPDTPLTASKDLDLPNCYVLYVGRLAAYKGIPYLLDSIKELKDIQFVIAGTGPLADNIRIYKTKNCLDNLLFIDRFITDEEKCELIARSSFIVFPSTNENEAFGIVQLEAMRYRKAIINTWIDSGVNFVAPHNECALTVPPCDSKALSREIKRLWNDKVLTSKLGSSGYKRFNAYFTEISFLSNWKTILNYAINEL